METVPSDDDDEEFASDLHSDRCGTYSPSDDVSESDSSTCCLPSASSPLARSLPPHFLSLDPKLEKRPSDFSEVEMIKELFAKLLLGEDMFGGGKGVCTALALSNAITNLSATVFGELWRLEPLAPKKKAMWLREMDWLLSVSDSIVELVPSVQELPGGGTFEVMVSRPRPDLHMNLPALKTLDAMLIGMLDEFTDTEFWYVDGGISVADADEDGSGSYPSSSVGRPSLQQEDKWWLPCPKVPHEGLSEDARKRLQQCRECVSQILKAAMATNSGVLAEMEIPDVFIETFPKNGKSCLGEIIYHHITDEQFSSDSLLDCLDLSSEHHTLEIANRIEAATHLWRMRGHSRHSEVKTKKSWRGKVKDLVTDPERSQLLAEQAECLLQSLRLRCPGLPQTDLAMKRIQYNKDVGHSILESYSRVMESLAFNIMARIDDLIFVDDATKNCSTAEAVSIFNRGGSGLPVQKKILPSPFSIQKTPHSSPFATPTYSSTSVSGSPGRLQASPSKRIILHQPEAKLGKINSGDLEKVWSFTGNVSARKDAGDAPERD
ncbi:rop guanine nucleotide exchange factor 1-like [Curcuma longa]|uniref:rop guanine nucleotide exchange factor 1-like n=1 Tax=Curcuma longa TaxID=136217 RepID=UPI003D9DBAC0